MSRRWRIWLFVVLAILFVIGVNQVTTRSQAEHHQSQAKSEAQKPAASKSEIKAQKPTKTARLVPMYAEGDLHVRKAAKTKKKTRPKKKKRTVRKKTIKKTIKKVKRKRKARRVRKKRPIAASRKLTGNRPVLEVAYKDIGFNRYLDVIERVGRLFVLMETENGTRLGPEISLKRKHLYPRGADMSVLAIKRPHLVSDDRIRDRLAMIKIPEEANDDRVVLILTKPFDDLLWQTITDALKKHRLRLHQVSQIVGDYVEGANGVFLKLDSVVVKRSGKLVRLNRKLRVSL
jgi:hypothetical protein